MTRINLIPPEELTDKHLVAEYRELPRIAKLAYNTFVKDPTFTPPPTYRLGKGHMKFFVDKGTWLNNRHNLLVREMLNRGYTVNFPTYPLHYHHETWRKDWEPSGPEISINLQRISDRKNKTTEVS